MELIIGLIVLVAVGFIIFRKKDDQPTSQLEVEVKAEAPLKVETPAPVVVEGAGAVDLPATPVVEEAPAKKTRKPRAPKAEATPAAKKAAPKKAAAPKAKTTKSKKA
jgi:hypothetical protein